MAQGKPSEKQLPKAFFRESSDQCHLCGSVDPPGLDIYHILPLAENPQRDPKHMIVLCAQCRARAAFGTVSKEKLYEAGRRYAAAMAGLLAAEPPAEEGEPLPEAKTPEEAARLRAYLEYLQKIYHEFEGWECKLKGLPYDPAKLDGIYQGEMECALPATPDNVLGKAIRFLQTRIEATKLAAIRKKKGKLYASFEDFLRLGGGKSSL